MTFVALKNNQIFKPALVLEALMARHRRRFVQEVFLVAMLLLLSIVLVGEFAWIFPKGLASNFQILGAWTPQLKGLFGLVIFGWISMFLLNAFYSSYYFLGVKRVFSEKFEPDAQKLPTSFALASVLYSVEPDDATGGFMKSDYGRFILSRCGIKPSEIDLFLGGERTKISLESLNFDSATLGPTATLRDLAQAIITIDRAFAQFLSRFGIGPKEFIGVADWAERIEGQIEQNERWWSRDHLGRIPGLGKNWSYGGAYALSSFAHEISEDPAYANVDLVAELGQETLREVEAILSRSHEANAIVTGDPGSLKMEYLALLGREIKNGTVLPPLEHKRMMVLDGNAFIAATKNKGSFESTLLKILNESFLAGNIILVLPNLPDLVVSAKALGSDLANLLEPFLASNQFQIIATAETGAFHQIIGNNPKLMDRFDQVKANIHDSEAVLRILEREVLGIEAREKLFFTFPALLTITESASRYFDAIEPADKAVDLLHELVPRMKGERKKIVSKEEVLSMIEAKTGIALGQATGSEKEKLLALEEILHRRVIGQNEAVAAIANALRRSRSGVANPNRPTGSFLFLGPTGVGKTEATKTLSEAFFGTDEIAVRLDMSEYRTDDAMERLIGAFESGKVGVLTAKLREHPYGVLLLDEFEKTRPEVLDLFLQILDEGFFADMHGKRVGVRNMIIIATSNAGSDLIWDFVKFGKNPAEHKDEIIEALVKRNIFKPELLNRFDGVMIFHPLDAESLRKIAQIMLRKLNTRLAGKGVSLEISDALLDALVKIGNDPKFGARPMNRAIQDKVELAIAEKLLRGEVKPGEKIVLNPAEIF